MTDEPDLPPVVEASPEVTGSVALVLWTILARQLVGKGVLAHADVRGMVKTAHEEFAREPGGEAAQALLARLEMNAA